MANANSTEVPRCAFCGQPEVRNRLFITFPLLASSARAAGIALKMRDSDDFHAICGRRVYKKLMSMARAFDARAPQ